MTGKQENKKLNEVTFFSERALLIVTFDVELAADLNDPCFTCCLLLLNYEPRKQCRNRWFNTDYTLLLLLPFQRPTLSNYPLQDCISFKTNLFSFSQTYVSFSPLSFVHFVTDSLDFYFLLSLIQAHWLSGL